MMNIEEFREYCLSRPDVTEGFPFDNDTLVFKAAGKMFALANIEKFEFINLKCDPDRAVQLREEHPEIRPGYHMNKQHWNSVYVNGRLDNRLIRELIDHSYELIIGSMRK